jgi:drug/metabolite transporter (DMT)-like permease
MFGFIAALGSAACSGGAAVLQARGVGRPAVADRLGPAMALRLARSGPYLAGLALVAAGFLLSLVALHQLPVFAVAASRATSLGVTALLAWPLLGVPIRGRQAAALAALAVGLVLAVSASRAGPAVTVPAAQRWAFLGVLAVLAVVATGIERRSGRTGGVALAVIAGLDFGLVGLAARAVSLAAPLEMLADPACWTLAAAAVHGLLVYATALQRTTVTSATAAMVGVETLTGSVAGVLLLGDGVREGWVVAGVVGFVLALGGALVLARSDVTAVTRQAAAGA